MSAFVEWFTLYMAAFPDVQEKVHAEVSRVAGNRRPLQAHRAEMHFTEATILEVMSCIRKQCWRAFVCQFWPNLKLYNSGCAATFLFL